MSLLCLVMGGTISYVFCDSTNDWTCNNASDMDKNLDMHQYLVMLVSMLLVFRTTASYEAYKTSVSSFSSMITIANNLGTQICSHIRGPKVGDHNAELLGKSEDHVKQLTRLCVLMCITIRRHLRDDDDIQEPSLKSQ